MGTTRKETKLIDENGLDISLQNPLQVDGDSVHAVDIWEAESDMNGFSGKMTDLFDNLHSLVVDNSATNPKHLLIHFNRTTVISSISLGAFTGDFSNVKIVILVSGGGEIPIIDESSDNTKYSSRNFELPIIGFNSMRIEFYTADAVTVSNVFMPKVTSASSRIQGVDPTGAYQNVTTTPDGNLTVSDNSSGLAIAEGLVTGKTFIHKFGSSPGFNILDGFITVWDGADKGDPYEKMVYPYSTTADIDTLSSDDAGNTQATEIQGLDANYDLVTQTLDLNGLTRVALTTPLIRVFRVVNTNSSDYAGHVFISVNGTLTLGVPTPANLRAVVHGENNQTEMAVYTIPAGKTGFMRDWYASTSGAAKDSVHVIKVMARPFGGVFQLKHKASIIEKGTSYIKHDYTEPEVFAEKTDVEIKCNTDKDGASVSAGFDIVLKDN